MENKHKKKIIYFGILDFNKENALCQRAISIVKALEEIGYEPILIGMSPSIPKNSYKKIFYRTFLCYEIHYPTNLFEWVKNLYNVDDIIKIIKSLRNSVDSLIVADYRFIATKKLILYCSNNNIKFIADIMDWFQILNHNNPIEYFKYFDSIFRIKFLYKKVDRRICISSNFQKLYQRKGCSVVIPGTIIPYEDKWGGLLKYSPKDKLHLVFAGKPGKKCEKERIDWALRAIKELGSEKFELYIAGITKKELIKNNPQLRNYVNEHTHFLGMISHENCIKLIKKSDFSLVLRNKNKLSDYGFSTKISESFACGTPVIATDTSDNNFYIKCGKNGYICKCNYKSFKKTLSFLLNINNSELRRMHQWTHKHNPLTYDKYTKHLERVIE